jgi:hypothetical protein
MRIKSNVNLGALLEAEVCLQHTSALLCNWPSMKFFSTFLLFKRASHGDISEAW